MVSASVDCVLFYWHHFLDDDLCVDRYEQFVFDKIENGASSRFIRESISRMLILRNLKTLFSEREM